MEAKPQYRKRLKNVIDLLNKLAEPELAKSSEKPTKPPAKKNANTLTGFKPSGKPR